MFFIWPSSNTVDDSFHSARPGSLRILLNREPNLDTDFKNVGGMYNDQMAIGTLQKKLSVNSPLADNRIFH